MSALVCLNVLYLTAFLRFFFFFSSRRRHTRSLCDWSSDVCSSDLPDQPDDVEFRPAQQQREDRADARRRERREKDRKSTRLNSSHTVISYAVFCLKKKKQSPEMSTQYRQSFVYRDRILHVADRSER